MPASLRASTQKPFITSQVVGTGHSFGISPVHGIPLVASEQLQPGDSAATRAAANTIEPKPRDERIFPTSGNSRPVPADARTIPNPCPLAPVVTRPRMGGTVIRRDRCYPGRCDEVKGVLRRDVTCEDRYGTATWNTPRRFSLTEMASMSVHGVVLFLQTSDVIFHW